MSSNDSRREQKEVISQPLPNPCPTFCHSGSTLKPRKFHIRRNNNKVYSIKTGRIVAVDLLP